MYPFVCNLVLDEPLSRLDYHLTRVLPQGSVGWAKNLDVAESGITRDPAEALAVVKRLAMIAI